jgi:hypothetical protein
MDLLMVVLRLLHIFSGVFWVGSMFLMVQYIQPTMEATAPEGPKFVRQMMGPGGLTSALAGASGLAVLSGIVMYGLIFDGRMAFDSGYGVMLSIGGLAGLAALIVGFVFQNRSSRRLAAIGREIEAAAGPPSAEQMAELAYHSARLSQGARLTVLLLVIALIGMSTAQDVG